MTTVTREEFEYRVELIWEEFGSRLDALKVFKERFRRTLDNPEPVNKDFDSQLEKMRSDIKTQLERLKRLTIAKASAPLSYPSSRSGSRVGLGSRVTAKGDINMNFRRVMKVHDPVEQFDAVNLRTFHERVLRVEENMKMRYAYLRDQIHYNRKLHQYWGMGFKDNPQEEFNGAAYPGLPPDPYPSDEDIISRAQDDFFESTWKPTASNRSPPYPGLIATTPESPEGKDAIEEDPSKRNAKLL